MAKSLLVILVGPSGAGKSTFLERILGECPEFCDIVTYTSRATRKGESEGNPYHFVSRDQFLQMIDQNFFVEWAEVHGNLYGTPRSQIEEAWSLGKSVIMDLDVQGARALIKEYPQVLTIFIHPPSIDELRHRIIKREGGVPRDLEVRMENALKEISAAGEFRYQLVNHQFELSYMELKKLIEEFRKSS